MLFLRQKPLAGGLATTTTPRSQLHTLSLSAPGSASTSPSCTPFLHAVALLPGQLFAPLNYSTLSLHPLSPLLHPWQVWQQVAVGVSVSSKSYDHKKKGNLCTVPFLWWNKIPKSVFLDLTKLLMHGFGYFAHYGSALTLLTRRYHKNRGSMYVVGELFAIDRRDLSRVGHICWCHSGNLYAFGNVMCDTPATLVSVSSWHHLYMVVISTSSCWIHYCYSPVGGTVKWWNNKQRHYKGIKLCLLQERQCVRLL
jgi:hypothetical protein